MSTRIIGTKPVRYKSLTPMGFFGHRVGSDGSFWSRWYREPLRGVGNKGKSRSVLGKWKRINGVVGDRGYVFIDLRRQGVWKRYQAHRIVLTAFAGPSPPGMVCRHFPDRDPSNNRITNLRWGTPKENQEDRKVHGTTTAGEDHPMAKLTMKKVRRIRLLWATGLVTKDELARLFATDRTNIGLIVSGKTWKDE